MTLRVGLLGLILLGPIRDGLERVYLNDDGGAPLRDRRHCHCFQLSDLGCCYRAHKPPMICGISANLLVLGDDDHASSASSGSPTWG